MDEAKSGVLSPQPVALPEDDLRWCTVSLHEVLEAGVRLKAAVFGVEGRRARAVLKRCRWPITEVAGPDGLAVAFHRPRFKRIWLDSSDLPIYQPGQATELDPKPSGFLSSITETDIDALRVSNGQILMTCSGRSGSIGRTAYVSKTLHNRIFSHDLIRIECHDEDVAGYLYAFLRTETGRALIRTNEYGAMIPHVEPSHLDAIPIPNPPNRLKETIHSLVIRSYDLRDESNQLLKEADRLLHDCLDLPTLSEFRRRYHGIPSSICSYAVSLSSLSGRLDASYHVPVVADIIRHLKKSAAEVTVVGDPRSSKRIVLPGRFARVYVEEGQGIPFFGGKQLHELDPTKKKFLSLTKHGDRIRTDLTLKTNMTLISRSGTIGKVALVPQHWENWIANEHIIRVEPAREDIAGYLYVFLASEYGRELIKRFTYGAVVDEIDDVHVSQIPMPLLGDSDRQAEINRLALEANDKRAEAYSLEQEAIRRTNTEVIHAGKK
jgi:type I restriction enzyme, S subunit